MRPISRPRMLASALAIAAAGPALAEAPSAFQACVSQMTQDERAQFAASLAQFVLGDLMAEPQQIEPSAEERAQRNELEDALEGALAR